ncbi:hypothetical protein AMYX_29060 [Anaeromyxobacter diazotrophicus]|uniref:Rhamnogalacturonase A/B/Epimerase-like pectate lyase domain-containing protein n=1 Tax=Anaeromyxobacter diazotrophicus TaxID=2590199 RepID=A0A7I9VP24_9BACT|nr:hypothetical protein AMYX_29060 [Anaeromyxobacter diazotrophicus]
MVGLPASEVIWSVREGAAGGTVTSAGVYLAPPTAGTYHVDGTSVADASKVGTATVLVTAAGQAPGSGTGTGATPPAGGATQPAGSVSVLDYGAKGDGVTDDTQALRNAAATGKPLWFPTPSAHYLISGTVELQNSAYGQNRPEIRMAPGVQNGGTDTDNGNNSVMFLVRNYQGAGMVIDSLHLNGSWNGQPTGSYFDNPPQWSHGLRIMGPSRNVTVQNCWIENTCGDNIALTWYQPASAPPDNIVIQNNKLVNPYRCTIALVGATNVMVRNNYHEKQTDFVTVIDLELDPIGYQYDRNITFENNVMNAARQWGNPGALMLSNPGSNPTSGPVTITGTRGKWSTDLGVAIVPNSDNLVGYSGAWSGTSASNNAMDGNTAWSFVQ